MKRMIRYLAILAGTLLVALIAAVVFARLYFTGDRILQAVRPQLEENLNRSIEIENAELSFWGGVGVRLEGVTLGNAPGFTRPFFLRLGELDVKVRFWPLLSGEVVFDRVLIGPGELRLEVDNLGNNNWTDITKPDTTAVPETAEDSALAAVPRIPLAGRMEFSAITVSLDDNEKGEFFELADIEGALNLDVRTSDSSINAAGSFRVGGGVVRTKAKTWDLARAQPKLEFELIASLPRRELELRRIRLEAFGIPIESSGRVENLGDSARYTVDVKIEPVTLARVFAQLPDSLWRPIFPQGPPEGSISADLTVTSAPPGEPYPYVEGKIQLSGVRGQVGTKNIPIEVAGLDIRLARTVASLSAQSMAVAGIPLTFNLTIDQPQAPNFSGGISGKIDVARLAELMESESDVEMGGDLDLAISAFGAVKNWRDLKVNGRVGLANIFWRPADPAAMVIDDLSGDIKFTGTGLEIEKWHLRSGSSTIEFTGQLDNLIPFLTHLGEGVERPRLQFEMRSEFVDLDRMFPSEEEGSAATAETAVPPVLPVPVYDLVADGTIRLDSAVYFGVPFGDFSCRAHFADMRLTLSEARGRAYSGRVTGQAEVDYTDWNRPAFTFETKGEAVEADRIIAQYTGLGGHIFGEIDLTGTFNGEGEEALDIVRSFTASGDLVMKEGRYEKFGLLSTLGKQAGLAGFADSGPIKNMTATYWIENGRLFCKDWNFTSSGNKYGLVGSVGFDGTLDYRIQITLPKKQGGKGLLNALGDLIGGADGVTLNLALTGSYDQPVIKLDSRENRRAFERNLKDQAKGLLKNLQRK